MIQRSQKGQGYQVDNYELRRKWTSSIRDFFSGDSKSEKNHNNVSSNVGGNSRIIGIGSPYYDNSSRDNHRLDNGGFFGAITGDINATALFEDDSQSYHEL